MDTGFPAEYAHIKFLVEGEYKFSFGYPILIQAALDDLRDKLKKTEEANGESPATTMIPLIMSVAPHNETLPDESKVKLNMMLCALLLHLCELQNFQIQAEKFYQLNMKQEDDGIVVEMHDVIIPEE